MICANCSTENVAGSKFCRQCGQAVAAGCPNCGFVNLPDSKFCSDCGAVLAAPITSARPTNSASPTTTTRLHSAPIAERRLVSVLFADLVGFTPFAEERDSEDVRETLTRYFEIARQVIERYGGTVEKFIGDAVMAVWGAPTAHEDDAERAVRAGLELVDAVRQLGSQIQARAGVSTGEAAVTVGATNQGMVAGDLVNTAARLQSVAPPGSVLVGETTQLAASAAIAFERVDDQVLKGKQSPVPAWRALRVVSERGGRNRAESLEAPFVGRTEDLRLLKDLFHATGREKRLRVVSVIGPGGIGKSRLAREFSNYLDGLVEVAYWHSGRSPAYGEGITFWALGEMVRERAGLSEGDDEQTTRARIGETVAQFVSDPSERDWVEPALLTLLGIDSGVAADQLFGAWRTFFERIAEQGTVVLAFEDMHFADTGLLDFVEHLLDWSRGLPIYVVTLARPDLIERRPDWGAGKRNFTSLYLEPLSDTDMRELLAGLVPGLPDSAVSSIVGRADGIPLYAVETVRTLLAEGRLVAKNGVYVPNDDLSKVAVPQTLTALIASRLDTLEETDRRIVHDAAVLGQSFTVAALSAVFGLAEADLEQRLAGLVRRELLQRQMDPRSPERGQYSFVQALIREVAYNTLSKHDRKKLHLATARYFESLGNDELAGALASHYLAAHANATEGPEADALAGQARIALKAAAVRARSLGAFDQAVSFLEQALSVAADSTERIELLAQIGSNARIAGRMDKAESALRHGLDLARREQATELIGQLTSKLAFILVNAFKPEEGLELIEPIVSHPDGLTEATLAELRLNKARLLLDGADFKRSLDELEFVLETAERRQLVSLLAPALMTRGHALYGLGRRREAWGLAYAARDLAAEHGLTDVHLRVVASIANGLTEQDLASAVETWRANLELARKAGHRGQLIFGVGNYGYTAFLAGEWDAGLAEMDTFLADEMAPKDRLIMLNNALVIRASRGESVDDGLREMEQLGSQMGGNWRAFYSDPLANAAQARGDWQAAHDAFLEILAIDPGQVEYYFRAGRAALRLGDVNEVRRLLARFSEGGAFGPMAEARRHALDAAIAVLEGPDNEALALYRDALRNFRAANAVWDEALTGLDMAEFLDPSEPEVAAVIASTRAIFERLRAKPYLERLDAAAARKNRSSAAGADGARMAEAKADAGVPAV